MFDRLVKFGFFLLYNQFAFTYELVAWLVSLGQWGHWRESSLAYLTTGPTLELACGTGRLLAALKNRHSPVAAIERSPFMLRLANGYLAARQHPPLAAQAQAQTLPFADGTFNNVVATFPTNYIFQPATLAAVRRVLRVDSQSRLIIVLQGQNSAPAWLNGFIDWLYRLTGQREIGKTRLYDIFEQAGFDAQIVSHHLPKSVVTLLLAYPHTDG